MNRSTFDLSRPMHHQLNNFTDIISDLNKINLYEHDNLDRIVYGKTNKIIINKPPRPIIRTRSTTKLITPGYTSPVESRDATTVFHVVSGLGKEQSTPIPDLNRTMANGDFGDDAAFYVETSNNYILGISDGAGGNRGYGFDPKRFARQLMRHCADYILSRNENVPSLIETVFTALQLCQDRKIYGSGTICICAFEKSSGLLRTINIGDSGYIIIRNNIILKSAKRSYRDDGSAAPLQLDVYPWSFKQRAKFMLDSGEIGNIQQMMDDIQLKCGDILMMASDGVFDNLSDRQLSTIIKQNINIHTNMHGASIKKRLNMGADAIVEASKNCKNAPDDVIVVLAQFL